MSRFSVVIPSSPFLLQRQAGLSGVARSVILADLEGANRIYIVSPVPIAPDWEKSFAARERALPCIVQAATRLDVPSNVDERLLDLPADRLATRDGMAFLLNNPMAELADDPDLFLAADLPGRITWQILLASMKPGEGWVGRHINRPISFRISALVMRGDTSPNVVTWFTFALALVMTAVLAQGSVLCLAIGGALYQAVSVIDCVDGDIARVGFRSSRAGAALDTTFDMLANLGFVAGVMIGVVRTYGLSHLSVAAGLCIVAALCMTLMTVLVRLGPKRGSFDVLRAAITMKLAHRPVLQSIVLFGEKAFKRDFYALFAALLCVSGAAWLVPQLGLLGVCIWLLAILWCAPAIIADKDGDLLPSYVKAI